jgi:hypothetical protein
MSDTSSTAGMFFLDLYSKLFKLPVSELSFLELVVTGFEYSKVIPVMPLTFLSLATG